eukprot:3329669-Pyramimonas_sp.AAC.1
MRNGGPFFCDAKGLEHHARAWVRHRRAEDQRRQFRATLLRAAGAPAAVNCAPRACPSAPAS